MYVRDGGCPVWTWGYIWGTYILMYGLRHRCSLFFSILPFLPPTTVVSYSAQYRASINNQVEIANSISITNLWLYRIELTSSLQLLTHPDQLPNNSHNDFQPFKSHASTPSNDMTHRKIERSLMLSMSPYPWYRIGGLKEDKK